jgi:putative transposase
VADYYEVEPALLAKRHDPHMARAVAAWLCRRHTEATLADLAEWLGLSRADSVPNLTRRLEAQLKSRPELLNDLAEIHRRAGRSPPNDAENSKIQALAGAVENKNKG